ncbi:Uncharacterized membrane protein [Novosphingobium sp. CF614]|uniref:DUF1624 domain-containing protein n=1 Tax=Novosphingobium sp. CF614 TaxID=1884364 RepID=UPI0008E583BA|nr:heparan-alpha-glucosaminide N-acetyltransferase domain-containing protein [Novosphingobium sp. CF614]SFG11670.1 Uncharacterized membrane protein [Novosphingobium sp. CF614]
MANAAVMGHVNLGSAPLTQPAARVRQRLQSIDALRGLVMVIMLLDHVRETWFLHMQVTDPMDAASVPPSLFFTRLVTNLCAPVFVALTGLGAWLYCQGHGKAEASAFLVKRGLFLIVLEVTLITMAWTSKLPPTFWLQVIWAIGMAMIALAALLHLPRTVLLVLGLAIVCGHNLLDPIHLSSDNPFYVPWAMLHQRDIIALPFGLFAKTTYPVLPWIGVISLGFAIGPWFGKGFDQAVRQRRLLLLGAGMIALFAILRALDIYGDKPWTAKDTPLQTIMAFLALTKYPPSLLFLLPTLGIGALLLSQFEKVQGQGWMNALAIFGAAPMFFYVIHLYLLRVLYFSAMFIWGPNHGETFGVDNIGWIWAWYALLLPVLYFPTVWFAKLKARRQDIAWLKYL